MTSAAQTELHVVVFDVNVYLDVARLLGPPFTWDKFEAASAAHHAAPVPCVDDPRVDSLRAIATCRSGYLAGRDDILEVWTSEHIDDLVRYKAIQPTDGSTAEDRGLGWSPDDADELVTGLVHGLVFDDSRGGQVEGIRIPSGTPPLSHEDGMVFAASLKAYPDEVAVARYCVTRDVEFRECLPDLPGEVDVLYPYEWLLYVRSARSRYAAMTMRPRPTGLDGPA